MRRDRLDGCKNGVTLAPTHHQVIFGLISLHGLATET